MEVQSAERFGYFFVCFIWKQKFSIENVLSLFSLNKIHLVHQ